MKLIYASRFFLVFLVSSATLAFSGCSVLVGNVKPTTEPAENYRAMDLSKRDLDWVALPSKNNPEDNSGDIAHSDIAYQSQKTYSIISVDSACGRGPETQSDDLQHYTNLLFLGMSDIEARTENNIQVSGKKALETTLQGKMNGESTQMKVVVIKHGYCVYDLMYISRPENFSLHQDLFQEFVNAFQVH